jgi:hypothetical protein
MALLPLDLPSPQHDILAHQDDAIKAKPCNRNGVIILQDRMEERRALHMIYMIDANARKRGKTNPKS